MPASRENLSLGRDHRSLASLQRVGWQPSRFLTDWAEAERDFAWAKRLGSITATVAELGPAGRC
jgi:hypothetical protein